jgi:hypothetical protein
MNFDKRGLILAIALVVAGIDTFPVDFNVTPDRPLTKAEIADIRATYLKPGDGTTWLHREGANDPSGRFLAADSLLEAIAADSPTELAKVVDIVDHEGYTPAHRAVKTKNQAYFRHLIEKWHADIDTRNKLGDTMLFDAAATGQEVIVAYLLEKGIDPNAKNSFGETALDEHKDDQTSIAELIKAAGGRKAAWDETITLIVGAVLLVLAIVLNAVLPRTHAVSSWFDARRRPGFFAKKNLAWWELIVQWVGGIALCYAALFAFMDWIYFDWVDGFAAGSGLSELLLGCLSWNLITFSAGFIILRLLRGNPPAHFVRALYFSACLSLVVTTFSNRVADPLVDVNNRRLLAQRGVETELIDKGTTYWKKVVKSSGRVVGSDVTHAYAYRLDGREYRIGIGDWPAGKYKVRYLAERPKVAMYGPADQPFPVLFWVLLATAAAGTIASAGLLWHPVAGKFSKED